MGHEPTSRHVRVHARYSPQADIHQRGLRRIRFVSLADIRAMADIISYAAQFRDLRNHMPA